jgi:hypothetical protein
VSWLVNAISSRTLVSCNFVADLRKESVDITSSNFEGLSVLSTQFGFQSLSVRLAAFTKSPDFRPVQAVEDSAAQSQLAALEERFLQRGRDIAGLQFEVVRQSDAQASTAAAFSGALAQISRLAGEVSQLRSALERDVPRMRADIVTVTNRSVDTVRGSL